jgi:hypothetical protein
MEVGLPGIRRSGFFLVFAALVGLVFASELLLATLRTLLHLEARRLLLSRSARRTWSLVFWSIWGRRLLSCFFVNLLILCRKVNDIAVTQGARDLGRVKFLFVSYSYEQVTRMPGYYDFRYTILARFFFVFGP